MGEPAAAADGDAAESASGDDKGVVDVAPAGDVVLDVTFETSPETLRRSRKAALAAARRAGPQNGTTTTATAALRPKVRVAYRVSLATLNKHSPYFANLLSNSQFKEAQAIAASHGALSARGVKPADAPPRELPWIRITDDDEATQAAGREHAFEDMLRIIHQQPPRAARGTMAYVTTLAIIADRFDCVAAVSRSLNTDLKFKWPATNGVKAANGLMDDGGSGGGGGHGVEAEQTLRQKVLVSWLLGQPMRLHQSTRELITRGSGLWSALHEMETAPSAAWWNLPDGLEHELQYRRECIINTVASVQRHFLNLYSSRERQCKLGYDSSAACDSFQLGQMLKFLVSKNLLFLVDFGPDSLDAVPDTSAVDIEDLLATLRQCPGYQIDKHHTNCGLRIRIEPVLDYIRAMLAASVVAIPHAGWKRRREDVSWVLSARNGHGGDGEGRKFAFTRTMATDNRLRHEGALSGDRMAKNLFTADCWDWTPEF